MTCVLGAVLALRCSSDGSGASDHTAAGGAGGATGGTGNDTTAAGGAGGGGTGGGVDGTGGSAGEPASGGDGGTEDASDSTSTQGNSTGGSGPGAAGAGGAAAVGPELDALSVAGVRVPLKPSFDPERMRYSVLASDPAGDLTVTAVAGPGLDLTVNGLPAVSNEELAIADAEPGSEIEVEVTDSSGASRVYTVLYLPADFPDFQVTALEPEASDDPIYVATRISGAYYAVKLDNQGVPLFYRGEDRNIYDFKKHPGGVLSFARETGTAKGSELILLDADFSEIKRVTSVGLTNTDRHEFHVQPNGNYILLAYEPTEHDLTPYGLGAEEVIVDSILQEVGPNDEVLFQWNSWDHLAYDESLHRDGTQYSHVNSVFVTTDGDWIISARGMSQVLKVDRLTGDVLWRLGGIANEFEFLNDEFAGICGQHTASQLANGNILLFDNGQYCWPEVPERGRFTRIVEYAIDETAMTAELVWSYSEEDKYARSQGSAQRLANGNTFIGWGATTTPALVSEVNAGGDVVFSMDAVSDGEVVSYRAWRFAD